MIQLLANQQLSGEFPDLKWVTTLLISFQISNEPPNLWSVFRSQVRQDVTCQFSDIKWATKSLVRFQISSETGYFSSVFRFKCVTTSFISFQITLFYMAPEYHTVYDTQFQTKQNVLKYLWKHWCFINLETYIKTILWTMNTNCLTIFVQRNFRRKSHSYCEYHIVLRPRNWGWATASLTSFRI